MRARVDDQQGIRWYLFEPCPTQTGPLSSRHPTFNQGGTDPLRTLIESIARLFAGILFAFIDARWFRAMCRPLIRLLSLNRDTEFVVEGQRMYARRMDKVALVLLYKFRANEYFERLLLEKVCQPGMTVADIGAHLGYFTLGLARRVGPHGKVHAFEPDPANVTLLTKAVQANALTNVELHAAAVAETAGTCRLYLCEENAGDNRIYDSGDGRPFIDVQTVALDQLLRGQKVDVVKMDIQGAETKALRGMKNLLAAHPDILVLSEFSPSLISKSGDQPEDFLNQMSDLGFDFFFVDSSRQKLLRIERKKLLDVRSSHKDFNLLFARTLPPELQPFLQP